MNRTNIVDALLKMATQIIVQTTQTNEYEYLSNLCIYYNILQIIVLSFCLFLLRVSKFLCNQVATCFLV